MSVCLEQVNSEEVFSRVKKVVMEVLKISEEKISLESNYIEDFGADSLDRITLVMELEDEFESEIPEDEAMQLVTVGATVNYIVSNLQKL